MYKLIFHNIRPLFYMLCLNIFKSSSHQLRYQLMIPEMLFLHVYFLATIYFDHIDTHITKNNSPTHRSARVIACLALATLSSFLNITSG